MTCQQKYFYYYRNSIKKYFIHRFDVTILIAVSQSAFLVIYAVIDENNPKADEIRHFDYSELINRTWGNESKLIPIWRLAFPHQRKKQRRSKDNIRTTAVVNRSPLLSCLIQVLSEILFPRRFLHLDPILFPFFQGTELDA